MLPSSKSPSTVPGRRAVPFLAASRSISAWGETTASGPSVPTPAPGRGTSGQRLRAERRDESHARAGPAAAALPPPRVTRRGLPSPGLRARVCRSGCRADLDFARRGSSPPPTRVRSQRRPPPAAAGARARARRRVPASPLPLQAPAPPTRRPRRQGRARLRCRPPGRAASRPQLSTSCSPDKPTDMLAWQAAGP